MANWTSDPVADAETYFADNRRPLGYCAECGYDVYKHDKCTYEEDKPMMIERKWFHEKCVMPFARSHWSVQQEVVMSSMLTSLARNRAKNRMRKKGMRRFCSKDHVIAGKKRGMSYFASHWRDWV